MDLDSSLDDIIGSRKKHPPYRKPHTSSSSSSVLQRLSSSSSRPTFRSTSRHEFSQRHNDYGHKSDLRSRISHNKKVGDWHRSVEKTDLRGRIGKRGSSGGGLTTASLPNRQRYQQRGGGATSYSYDNNDSDMGRQDPHELIITKTVNQRSISSSSHSASSSSMTRPSRIGGVKGRAGGEVDPTSIVITKKIENTKHTTAITSPRSSSTPKDSVTSSRQQQQQQQQQQDIQQQQLLQQINEAEQLKQYLQQQQEQEIRQQMDRHLQQQLQSQRELILDLQRQLDQRTQQSFMQQHALHLGGSNFSFRLPVNNGNQYSPSAPPYNQSAPNIVILSNLDPNATASDVKTACDAFGPVIRCELIKDTRGRSSGEAEVEYLDRQSALDCIAKFDNEYVDERLIRATLRQPPTQQPMRSVIAPTRSGYRTTSQVLYTSKRP